MSQFDFPRIHFSGYAYINPATANNNILLPLVTYDPIQVKAILPPRIYLSQDLMYLHKLGGLPIPAADEVLNDEKNQPYIEIKPVGSREKFISWAGTPLGSSDLDAAYHALYEIVLTKRTKKPLTGHLPANWNFYGGMEFGFREVQVKSVAILNENQELQLVTAQMADCPSDLTDWLGASLNMENEQGKSTAVMVDVLPSLAFYSQVFCDRLQLLKEGRTIMSGKPRKASLRFLNQHRIVNQVGALAASGTFFSVIPVEELEGDEYAPIMKFFSKHGTTNKPIRGVFVRYNLFEVQENLMPDYSTLRQQGNPAYATVVGSLSPWYEEDMASIAMGRLLVPEAPFLYTTSLAPIVGHVDAKREVVSLDLLGSIPEQRVQPPPTPSYETYPLGMVRLLLTEEGKRPLELGRFRIDNDSFSREHLFTTSSILEFPCTGIPESTLRAGSLALSGFSASQEIGAEQEVLLLKESEHMVATDQAGLYIDQGDNPLEGYISNSSQKEPCRIRIYHKGLPVQAPVPMTIMELKLTEGGASAAGKEFLKTTLFHDKEILHLPTDQAANALYIFYPGTGGSPTNDLIQDIVRTGFFVSLRVLPTHDFGKYLDTTHPEYPFPVTFDVLYREVLQVYDLIFPVASMITPFTETHFLKGWKYLQHRLSPDHWGTSTYMPSSRDLSRDQWALFCKWVEQLPKK